ncbi:MAG: Holliday junction resolvase RuvX [Bacteroidia bacterium]
MPRLLSIDYGSKRTGLAWTDPMQIIATGVGAFDTTELMARLADIIAKEDIEGIVVGFPIKEDGSETDSTPLVAAFIHELDAAYPEMPIYPWDEQYTSKRATEAMIQAGAKKKKRRDKYLINEVSAVIILQDFMEANEEGM